MAEDELQDELTGLMANQRKLDLRTLNDDERQMLWQARQRKLKEFETNEVFQDICKHSESAQ